MRLPSPTWSRFRHVGQQAQHLDDVMQQLGISPLRAARLQDGDGFAQARRTCLECRYEGRCRLWLGSALSLETPPHFCPNAPFFAACRTAATSETRAKSG